MYMKERTLMYQHTLLGARRRYVWTLGNPEGELYTDVPFNSPPDVICSANKNASRVKQNIGQLQRMQHIQIDKFMYLKTHDRDNPCTSSKQSNTSATCLCGAVRKNHKNLKDRRATCSAMVIVHHHRHNSMNETQIHDIH